MSAGVTGVSVATGIAGSSKNRYIQVLKRLRVQRIPVIRTFSSPYNRFPLYVLSNTLI